MSRLRRALGPIVAFWLSCHVGQLVAVPVVFWAGHGDALLECTCAHGDHAICPMHHKPAPGSTICLMQSTTGDDAAVLAATLTFVGVLGTVPQLTPPASPRLRLVGTDAFVLTPLVTPDPPPPRA